MREKAALSHPDFIYTKNCGAYGGDAAENRKFESGKVALLGSKKFQHLMFTENFKFFKLKIYGSDAAKSRKFESGNVALLGSTNFQHLMLKNFNV